ncbi:MAG: mechanosensitive ion channel family protein [Candidatus Peribacteraceae bacterium]|nr:mechanosensitive ion channel family protein [Candidatus Peribacteraceae bacterium]
MTISSESLSAFIRSSIDAGFLADVAQAAMTFIIIFAVLLLFKKQALTRLDCLARRTPLRVGCVVTGAFQGIGMPFFIVVALFASVQHMALSPTLDTIIRGAFLIVLIAEIIQVSEKVIVYFLSNNLSRGKEQKQVSAVISVIVKILLWSVGLLLVLSNLGFNVNSLIASLGIGGIAISLALQNILSDIFSSFSIVMDKPFEEGDFVMVGEHSGTVKHIGLKTTRIQALQGEEIIISNNELTSTRIRNFKKLQQRRIVFSVNVAYGTPAAKLKSIPKMLKEVVSAEKKAKFDRAHLKEFGDFSLNYEVVYYILDNDYSVYMDVQQRINLAILKAFEKEGITIPFPTQTLHVAQAA